MDHYFHRRKISKIILLVFFAVVVTLLIFLAKGIVIANTFMSATGLTPRATLSLVFGNGVDLGAIDGRVNVLLLGIAGGNHDGADLTDTQLVLSFHPEKKSLSMISVPRDIWSDTLKDKVNSAYHYGEQKRKDGGIVLSQAIISDMVGLPIQHTLVFNFLGFEKIIDLVGGITIDVPIAFTDPDYPIAGKENDMCDGDKEYTCRFETLSFQAGMQQMNGNRALKYVRSRNAIGAEGTDFARGKRQQEVLLAVRERLMSKDVLTNPSLVLLLYKAFEDASDTDMNVGELMTLGKLFIGVEEGKSGQLSIEDQLYTPPQSWYGRYVLLPKESFEKIHAFIKSKLDL